MVTLLQFKIIHGLTIVGFPILMTLLAILIIYKFGQNHEQLEYEKRYNRLQFYIEYGLINDSSRRFIKDKFEEISKNRYCNREKLQVLERRFFKKYGHEKSTVVSSGDSSGRCQL